MGSQCFRWCWYRWGCDQPGVAARAEALGVATVVRRDACNDASVTKAVCRILDDVRDTERANTISKRQQEEDAVKVACTRVESFSDRPVPESAPAPSILFPGKVDFRRIVWQRER
jgi:UDP:flavonoid glycosyltransferase YjiC (YdhE family)